MITGYGMAFAIALVGPPAATNMQEWRALHGVFHSRMMLRRVEIANMLLSL
jgi:hypothetical protein